MKVKEFMTTDVVTCTQEQTVEEAAKLMYERSFSVLPIVDESKKLVGVITESDFVGKEADIPHALASIKQLFGQMFYFNDVEPIYTKARKRKLAEVMTKDLVTISPDTGLTDVVNMMVSKKLKRLPVVENGHLVGIVTRKDLLKAFLNNQ